MKSYKSHELWESCKMQPSFFKRDAGGSGARKDCSVLRLQLWPALACWVVSI